MARPEKQIPIEDTTIKGLNTLIDEGLTHQQIADYYTKVLCVKFERSTITKKIKDIKKKTTTEGIK